MTNLSCFKIDFFFNIIIPVAVETIHTGMNVNNFVT